MIIWVWSLLALFIAFLLSLLTGSAIIAALRRASFGQAIREIGPTWHRNKSGTPTMGAFIFFAGLFPASIFVGLLSKTINIIDGIVVLTALLFGVIGFSDDYIKVIKKRNLGLTAGQKFAAQTIVSVAFSVLMFFFSGREVLFGRTWHEGSYFLILFNILVMLATVNAVNLTDGIDGLAGGTSVVCMLYFALAAYWCQAPMLTIFLAAVIGGTCGFLCYNRHPAKVFMGDTGSLFLGGLIGAVACRLGIQFTLIAAGLVFFLETLSVILQVGYFKLTHGKRIFLMTPIHHHFEKKGWSEVKIVTVAMAITGILGIVSAWYVALCI